MAETNEQQNPDRAPDRSNDRSPGSDQEKRETQNNPRNEYRPSRFPRHYDNRPRMGHPEYDPYEPGHIPNYREDYGSPQSHYSPHEDPNWRYWQPPYGPYGARGRESPEYNPQHGDQPNAHYGGGHWHFPYWVLPFLMQNGGQQGGQGGNGGQGGQQGSQGNPSGMGWESPYMRERYGNQNHVHYHQAPSNPGHGNPGHNNPGHSNPGHYSDNPGHGNPHSNPGHNPGSNPGHHYGNPGHSQGGSMRHETEGKVEIENKIYPGGNGGGCNDNNSALLAMLMADRSRSNEGHSSGEHMGLLTALLADRSRDNGNRGWGGPGWGGDGFGFGGGGAGLWPLLFLAGGRGFGGFGHDHHGGPNCINNCNPRDRRDDNDPLAIVALQALNSIQSAIPTVALQTQNQICESTGSLALGMQQGFANNKDATQALGYLLSNQINQVNANVSEQGCKNLAATLAAQNAIISKIDGNRISQLETELARCHVHDRARESEINIRQEVNQAAVNQQSQWQTQRIEDDRHNRLLSALAIIGNQVQRARNENETINFGTMAASGNQSSQNTQVR